MTVQEEYNRGNANTAADMNRLAHLGDGLAQNSPRSESLVVAAHLAVPSHPARQILRCRATVGGTTGICTPADPETTPAVTQCVVDELGRIEFAAADAVTACEVTYVPVEGDLVTETIPVTAGGVGTLLQDRSAISLVSANLLAPAATPGVKTQVARGTAVPGAGSCAIQDVGTTINFVAAEAGVACTAVVSYYAFPGVGASTTATMGLRLEAAYDNGLEATD